GAKSARACGVSAAGVPFCSLAEHEEAERPRWAVGASSLFTSTALRFGGALTAPAGKYEFSPGPTASLGADWRVFDDRRTFVLLTSALSFSASETHLGDQPSVAYEAFDLRLGGQLGVVVADAFRPYAVVRAFGGPV